jgi:GTPase SAR1 family protein
MLDGKIVKLHIWDTAGQERFAQVLADPSKLIAQLGFDFDRLQLIIIEALMVPYWFMTLLMR